MIGLWMRRLALLRRSLCDNANRWLQTTGWHCHTDHWLAFSRSKEAPRPLRAETPLHHPVMRHAYSRRRSWLPPPCPLSNCGPWSAMVSVAAVTALLAPRHALRQATVGFLGEALMRCGEYTTNVEIYDYSIRLMLRYISEYTTNVEIY